MNTYLKEYYQKNKHIIKKYSKEYRNKMLKTNQSYSLKIKNQRKEYYIKNRDKILDYSKKYRKKYPDKFKIRKKLYSNKKYIAYNIKPEEIKYFGICPICKEEKKLVLDHNHNTGKFRAFICNLCNSILGFSKDNDVLLNEMILYINKHK